MFISGTGRWLSWVAEIKQASNLTVHPNKFLPGAHIEVVEGTPQTEGVQFALGIWAWSYGQKGKSILPPYEGCKSHRRKAFHSKAFPLASHHHNGSHCMLVSIPHPQPSATVSHVCRHDSSAEEEPRCDFLKNRHRCWFVFPCRYGREGNWRVVAVRQSLRATSWSVTLELLTPLPWTPTWRTPTGCGPVGWWSTSSTSPSLPPARRQSRGRWPISPPGCPVSPLRRPQARLLTKCSSVMAWNVIVRLAVLAASKSSTWTGIKSIHKIKGVIQNIWQRTFAGAVSVMAWWPVTTVHELLHTLGKGGQNWYECPHTWQ